MSKITELRRAGSELANAVYDLIQTGEGGVTLAAEDCQRLSLLCRRWDLTLIAEHDERKERNLDAGVDTLSESVTVRA